MPSDPLHLQIIRRLVAIFRTIKESNGYWNSLAEEAVGEDHLYVEAGFDTTRHGVAVFLREIIPGPRDYIHSDSEVETDFNMVWRAVALLPESQRPAGVIGLTEASTRLWQDLVRALEANNGLEAVIPAAQAGVLRLPEEPLIEMLPSGHLSIHFLVNAHYIHDRLNP